VKLYPRVAASAIIQKTKQNDQYGKEERSTVVASLAALGSVIVASSCLRELASSQSFQVASINPVAGYRVQCFLC
jgi:hypothetical protein